MFYLWLDCHLKFLYLFFDGTQLFLQKNSMATQLVLFFHISSSWVNIRFYTENQLPRLSGSGIIFFDGTPIFFLHIPSSWVKIRLHTENWLPRLPGSAL